jgi:hypothetical protein
MDRLDQEDGFYKQMQSTLNIASDANEAEKRLRIKQGWLDLESKRYLDRLSEYYAERNISREIFDNYIAVLPNSWYNGLVFEYAIPHWDFGGRVSLSAIMTSHSMSRVFLWQVLMANSIRNTEGESFWDDWLNLHTGKIIYNSTDLYIRFGGMSNGFMCDRFFDAEGNSYKNSTLENLYEFLDVTGKNLYIGTSPTIRELNFLDSARHQKWLHKNEADKYMTKQSTKKLLEMEE